MAASTVEGCVVMEGTEATVVVVGINGKEFDSSDPFEHVGVQIVEVAVDGSYNRLLVCADGLDVRHLGVLPVGSHPVEQICAVDHRCRRRRVAGPAALDGLLVAESIFGRVHIR